MSTDQNLTRHVNAMAPHGGHEVKSAKGIAGGYASLDSSGKVPVAQIPAGTGSAHHATHEPGGSDAMAVDASASTGSLRTIGTGAAQACAGNDSRLSDSRTPLAHTHPESDVTSLVSDLAGKQASDATLTALAALDATVGLVEQTGADVFTKRALGVGASTSVPTRADADARFAALSHTHAESDVTSLVTDLAAKEATANKAAANGYASLDSGTKVPIAQIPTGSSSTAVCIGNDSRLSDSRTPTAHASSHQNNGSDVLSLASISGQLPEAQGYGGYVLDYVDISEPGSWEIPAIGFLEIDETDGPNALMCYSARVHPSSYQCMAEASSLLVLDYYDITESFVFEIPASALMEIAETSNVRDFDIS